MKDYKDRDESTTTIKGEKIKKSECLIEVLGDLDELNCIVGLCRSVNKDKMLDEILKDIQTKIFETSSIIAGFEKYKITEEDIKSLERKINTIEKDLKPLKNFIYPSGSLDFCFLQYARAVCRRVERNMWKVKEERKIDENIIKYFNRLSDFLFVLSRLVKERKNENYEIWR